MLKKKIWLNFPRIIEVFTHKIVTKPSKIWVWNPGSGKNLFRIPDPDPQHCSLVRIRLIWIRIWILRFWTSWIRIHYLYRSGYGFGSGSCTGSLHQKAEKLRKVLNSDILWLLNDLLSFKAYVNVHTVRNKQETYFLSASWHHWWKEQGPDP